jgi:hypothetical protein
MYCRANFTVDAKIRRTRLLNLQKGKSKKTNKKLYNFTNFLYTCTLLLYQLSHVTKVLVTGQMRGKIIKFFSLFYMASYLHFCVYTLVQNDVFFYLILFINSYTFQDEIFAIFSLILRACSVCYSCLKKPALKSLTLTLYLAQACNTAPPVH